MGTTLQRYMHIYQSLLPDYRLLQYLRSMCVPVEIMTE
jgi:hypothetical protein